MSIKDRIEKLEQHTGTDQPSALIVYVCDSNLEAEKEAAREKAIAEYRAKHPDWEPSHLDWYISVLNERTKANTEEILEGKSTVASGNE